MTVGAITCRAEEEDGRTVVLMLPDVVAPRPPCVDFHAGRRPWKHACAFTRRSLTEADLDHRRDSNLGTTSVYVPGIDKAEIINTVHARRAPMIPGQGFLGPDTSDGAAYRANCDSPHGTSGARVASDCSGGVARGCHG